MRANRQTAGRVNEKPEKLKPEFKDVDLNTEPRRKLIQKLKVVQVVKDSFFFKKFSQCILQ